MTDNPSPDTPPPPLSSSHPRPPLLTDITALADGPLTTTSSPIDPRRTPDHIDAPSSSSSSVRPPGPSITPAEDIEMKPIVAGHRRRTSSLIGAPGGAGASRPRAGTLTDEPKILEEGEAATNSMLGRHDPRDSFNFSDEDLHDDEEAGLTGKDRRRKQKKRRRNTLLDQRIIQEKDISQDEQQEADKSVVRRITVNLALILLWYALSLALSMYNKWMFDEDRLNFPFPLFTTSMHMVVQFCLASLVLYLIPSLRPGAARKPDGGQSRHEDEPQGSGMSKMFYLTRIAPCGAATGLDIGLGNTSLKFISLTFYTMCKSSSLAFVLLFAFAFRLEQPTWRLVAIIATMIVGVVLMVFGEVEFEVGGFILVISAAFFSGFRWALTQILLLRNAATSNPFSSIFFLTPVMFVILFSLAIPVEGFGPLWEGLGRLSDAYGAILSPFLMMLPGCIAFLMTASEFALLQRTSVVTLSIAGIFKEVVTISAASFVFDDVLTPINLVGLVVTLIAIIAYNYIKIMKMRSEAQADAHSHHLVEDLEDLYSPSTGSDLENDEPNGESAGLLRRASNDVDGPLVTSDGDIQPNFLSSPTIEEHRESKARAD